MFFDHFAAGRATLPGKIIEERTKRAEFDTIRRLLPTGSTASILEVGPGQGGLARLFLAAGFSRYDIVEPNDRLRNDLLAVGVRRASAQRVPRLGEVADSAYDLVICSDVFEHLNDCEAAETFIAEVVRVLRPGGQLCLISPDYLDWGADFFNCDYSHNHVTTVRRCMQIFTNAGLETVSHRYSHGGFGGIIGFLLGRLVKTLTSGAKGNAAEHKLYKLRLTFLRRFMILARKS